MRRCTAGTFYKTISRGCFTTLERILQKARQVGQVNYSRIHQIADDHLVQNVLTESWAVV